MSEIEWPFVNEKKSKEINLRLCKNSDNAVYSFIVDETEKFGWITAFSPSHHILLGYIWKRKDYPWIHHWLHFKDNEIQYRGIEFGTAGIHQPFPVILGVAVNVFGERTVEYLDARETSSKSFLSFTCPTYSGYEGVEAVELLNETLSLKPKDPGADIKFTLTQEMANELSR